MPGLSRSGVLDPDALFAPYAHQEKIGLAVSGGPDSLALLLLAARWSAGPRFHVYAVDHRLRPEAADEAAMVVRESLRLGIPATSLCWDGEKSRTGIQAAAREARYRLIADAMRADGCALLFTAHHLGDQAETVLMRLAHGSGIEGLRGMDSLGFVAGCRIARPLLEVAPEVLHALVADAGLMPAHDPGNLDRAYERVRWRQFLPALAEMGITPGRLGTFARRMSDAASLIGDEADRAHRELVSWGRAGEARLPHGRVAVLNPQVAVAMLEVVLRNVSGDDRPPPLGPLEAVHGRLAMPGKFLSETLHGCVISSDGDIIRITREGPRRFAAGKAPRTDPSST